MGDALDARFLPKRSSFLFVRTAALPGVFHHPLIKGSRFPGRAGRGAGTLGSPALSSAHERPPPSVRSGIADGAEHVRIGRRMECTRSKKLLLDRDNGQHYLRRVSGIVENSNLRLSRPRAVHFRFSSLKVS